ncbi:acVLRF1 family peptidyl-tRNA hydrolase [Quadrisphaera sp. GCM10027208]|uniref:acVLRF1 family peptidyl-tRNA hydrolase n=1 Tax=Quadrisphaera sp. GCM10027208 TaxID=3273423 RepID=UPI003605BE88
MPPERLVRWVSGFGERHGTEELTVVREPGRPDVVRVTGADGARADLEVPWSSLPAGDDPLAALVEHAARPRTAFLLLVRRGGFAAGVARTGHLLDHSVGSRHVQGRTAAGGWSQQRFARRRAGQAAVLEDAAVQTARRLLDRLPAADLPEVVVRGGDRRLVDAVLTDPRLRPLADLPRSPLLDVRDPRLAVLEDTAQRARAVRVRLTDPPPPTS